MWWITDSADADCLIGESKLRDQEVKDTSALSARQRDGEVGPWPGDKARGGVCNNEPSSIMWCIKLSDLLGVTGADTGKMSMKEESEGVGDGVRRAGEGAGEGMQI